MQKITIRRDPNKRNGKEYPRWITQWRVNGKIKTVYLGSCAKMTEAEAQAKAEQLKNGNGVTNVIPNTENKKFVWCSDCATKFSIPPTESKTSHSCPNCGRNAHIHYMPVSPGTIKVPSDVSIGIVISGLFNAWRALKDKKIRNCSDPAKACLDAWKIFEECRETGVIEDLSWCPSCESYVWDAENKRYYYPKEDEIVEYAPGTACNIKPSR